VPSIHSETNSDRPFQQLGMDQQARLLTTGIPRIDAFLGGFKPSTITLADTNHPFAFEMLSMLCVNAVKAFDENVVYVDGGISIDPYAIASLSKRSGLRADTVLSKIKVARAFTAYQLDSIISDRLEAALSQYEPSLLIVSCITDLLMDRNVREKEAITILRRSLALIEKSAIEHKLITIVTKRIRHTSSRASALNDILIKGAGEIIEITRKKKSIELRLINRDLVMDYSPLSVYQTTLDEFIGGVHRG
jgi:hypothetical protein